MKGFMYALLGGTLWGLSGTCSSYIFTHSEMSSTTLTIMRLIGAGVILCFYNVLTHKDQKTVLSNKSDLIKLVLFSLIGLMLCQLSYLKTIEYSNSGTATVFQYSGLILIMIVTCIIEKHLPRRLDLLAGVFVVVGVVLIATHGQLDTLVVRSEALWWGLFSAIALMTYTLLPKSLLEKYDTTAILGYAMLLGGIVLGFINGVGDIFKPQSIDIWIVVGMVIVGGTAMAFMFYLQGVKMIGPIQASMIACVEPVVATISSFVWLKTSFMAIDLIGFVAILIGVLIVSSHE